MYVLYKESVPIGYCRTKGAAIRAQSHYEFAYAQEHGFVPRLRIEKIDSYLSVRFGYAYIKYMEEKENVACSRN